MESGQVNENLKDSTEERDQQPANNDEAGAGRFYECMFCKRGFSTAQALGGHMNIHRRDRARTRQQPPPANSGSIPAQQLPNYPSHQYSTPLRQEAPTNYHGYVPTATSSSQLGQTFRGDGSVFRMRRRQLSLFGEESNVGPGHQVGSGPLKDGEEEKRDGEGGELDLELRLGHERP